MFLDPFNHNKSILLLFVIIQLFIVLYFTFGGFFPEFHRFSSPIDDHLSDSIHSLSQLASLSSYDSWSIQQLGNNLSHISQVDISPTISLLFELDISTDNHGQLIPELFPFISETYMLHLYHKNAIQIFKKYATHLWIEKLLNCLVIHEKFRSNTNISYTQVKDAYKSFLDFAHQEISFLSNHSQDNIYQMIIALILATIHLLAMISLFGHIILKTHRSSLSKSIIWLFLWSSIVANIFYEWNKRYNSIQDDTNGEWWNITVLFINSIIYNYNQLVLFILILVLPIQIMYILDLPFVLVSFIRYFKRIDSYQILYYGDTNNIDSPITVKNDQNNSTIIDPFSLWLCFLFPITWSLCSFSSSYIKEEYNFWYFWTTLLGLYFSVVIQRFQTTKNSELLHSSSYKYILASISIPLFQRFFIRWNPNGFMSEHGYSMRGMLYSFVRDRDQTINISYSVICALWLMSRSFFSQVSYNWIHRLWITIHLLWIFLYKGILNPIIHDSSPIFFLFTGLSSGLNLDVNVSDFIAKLQSSDCINRFYPSLAIYLLISIFRGTVIFLDGLSICIELLFILLQREYNVPLLLVFIMQYYSFKMVFEFLSLRTRYYSSREKYSLWILFCAFFFSCLKSSYWLLGQSNLISTIDLTNVYTGLSDYKMILLGPLLFLITWNGPILFSIIFFPSLFMFNRTFSVSGMLPKTIIFRILLSFIILSIILSEYTLLISNYLFLDHLFMWSIYSSNHLYELFWIIFYVFIVLWQYLLF